jgi:hypothetical protein
MLSGIALQSFVGLLFEEMAEILRFWQGGVNSNGAPSLSCNRASRHKGNPALYLARASECRSLTPGSLMPPRSTDDQPSWRPVLLLS